MTIITHSKDLDGHCSGAICKRKFPEAKLIGWDYGNPIPWDQINWNEQVIMIDISFPMFDMMSLLSKTGNQLTWIDHHISAKKEYDNWEDKEKLEINYIYQLGIAACEIGWKHFFPDEKLPEAVLLLGEYDTWRNQDKERWKYKILPFQYFMRVYCTSPETFDTHFFTQITTNAIEQGINKGKSILKYQEQQDMLACQRSSFEMEFEGLRAICLNQGAFSSNTLQTIYDPEKHDIMLGFQYNGKFWNVSLRSAKDNIDVSVIAKSRGGGGHKAAAGFEAKTFEEIFSKQPLADRVKFIPNLHSSDPYWDSI